MKAIIYERAGGLDVIKQVDIERPILKDGETLIKSAFTSVNHVDLLGRMDLPWHKFPRIPGSDLSGVVEESKSGAFKPGDKVVAYPIKHCGLCYECRRGAPNSCDSRMLYGDHLDGFFREYVVLQDRNIIKIPDALPLEWAGALPVAYGTVWHALIRRVKLMPSEKLLIIGGSGGAGVAALQIGKLVGAEVITTTSVQWKARRLEELGANQVIDTANEESLLAIKGTMDVVLDNVGGKGLKTSITALKKGGRLATMGMTAGSTTEIDLRDIYSNNIRVEGIYGETQADITELTLAVARKAFKPLIDSVFPLERVAEAQSKMEERKHLGKIVLRF